MIEWSPWQYLELCRVCKLYDFERHCWTDFEGKTTSETGLPTLAFKGLNITRKSLGEAA
ncbi:MAG: hypothetical protein JWO08_3084 [Verrucomicrobiaceae bacterium]|nr:hypothetical protein [Verrucomicrobiaceae bacterium]